MVQSTAAVASDVRAYIVDRFMFGQGGDALSNDDSLLERGILDSMAVIELVAFVEQQFGIKVLDEELVPDHFDSVNRVAAFIVRKAAAPALEPPLAARAS